MKTRQKIFSQNFLIDKNVITKILNLSEIKNNNIVEIGPGTGALLMKFYAKNPNL